MPEGTPQSHGVVNDLGSGVDGNGETEMLYMHPRTFLWLQEQDRERLLTQRALERAARAGGEQRPGLARGGISSFARLLRKSGSALSNIRLGGARPSTDLGSTSGI